MTVFKSLSPIIGRNLKKLYNFFFSYNFSDFNIQIILIIVDYSSAVNIRSMKPYHFLIIFLILDFNEIDLLIYFNFVFVFRKTKSVVRFSWEC